MIPQGVMQAMQGMTQQAPMQQAPMQQAPKQPGPPPEPGAPPFTLEDATLHHLQLLGATASVRDVVSAWFVADYGDPHGMVIDRAVLELNELGYATMTPTSIPARPTVMAGSFRTSPTATVDCDRRAAIEASATDVLGRWRAFLEAPDGLGPTLLGRCGDGIASRILSDDAGSMNAQFDSGL
jgi:hypothetical protein